MTEKEQTIKKYQEKLGLTYEEALQLWKDEEEDNLPELSKEQQAVVKKMTQADRKKETTPRQRERKADIDKQTLITAIFQSLHEQSDNVKIVNNERQIDFHYNGGNYSVTLTKHRDKKKE